MVKKSVHFDVTLKTSDRTPSHSFKMKQKVMTNDKNSVEITFRATDVSPSELTGATASVMLYMQDGSFFQSNDVTVANNVFKYTMKPNETKHKGLTKVQLVVISGTIDNATLLQEFEIIAGLEHHPITEVMIQDWTTLTAEAKAFVDQIEGFTLESFVENKMGEELANLEVNYATRLTGLEQKDNQLTAQLAQKTSKGNVSINDINKNLGKFDQSFMTDEFINQFVNNSQPLNIIPADGSITTQKLAKGIFANVLDGVDIKETIVGINKFNKDTARSGTYDSVGGWVSSTTHKTSELIEIEQGRPYSLKDSSTITFFDKNKVFIRKATSNALNINDGAAERFFTATLPNSGVETMIIALTSEYPINYVPYSEKYMYELDSSTWEIEDESLTSDKISTSSRTINILDFNSLVDGKYYGGIVGEVATQRNLRDYSGNTQPISVSEGDVIRFNKALGNVYFIGIDSSGFIRQGGSIIVPVGERTVVVSPGVIGFYTAVNNTHIPTAMITQNNTIPNVYVPYKVSKHLEWLEINNDNLSASFQFPQGGEGGINWYSHKAGKELLTFGNSRTWQDGREYGPTTKEAGQIAKGYQTYIREQLGMSVTNKGVSGARLNHTLDTLKNHTFNGNEYGISLMQGTNNFNAISGGEVGHSLGTVDHSKSGNYDVLSYAGAVQAFVEWMSINKPKLKVYLISDAWCFKGGYGEMERVYSDIMREVAELYHYPFLDLYHLCGFNEQNMIEYFVDPGAVRFHENTLAYERISEIIVPFIANH